MAKRTSEEKHQAQKTTTKTACRVKDRDTWPIPNHGTSAAGQGVEGDAKGAQRSEVHNGPPGVGGWRAAAQSSQRTRKNFLVSGTGYAEGRTPRVYGAESSRVVATCSPTWGVQHRTVAWTDGSPQGAC